MMNVSRRRNMAGRPSGLQRIKKKGAHCAPLWRELEGRKTPASSTPHCLFHRPFLDLPKTRPTQADNRQGAKGVRASAAR